MISKQSEEIMSKTKMAKLDWSLIPMSSLFILIPLAASL